jgi:hypothetical protein
VLTYGGGWPNLDDEQDRPYEPLAERESLYEEFAAIGKRALDLGDSGSGLPSYYRPFATEHNPDDVISIPQTEVGLVRAGNAETEPLVQKLLLDFVRDYGPPRNLTADEWRPRRFGDRWSVGIPVGLLLMDAARLYRAMERARDVDMFARSDQVDRGALRSSQFALATTLMYEMKDTRLILIVDQPNEDALPALRRSTMCLDLLGAMWWQLYEAVANGGPWLTCEGCSRLFIRHHEKQKYHDPACRNRTNVRRSAKKRNDGRS